MKKILKQQYLFRSILNTYQNAKKENAKKEQCVNAKYI